jgi:hypothetical protein
VNNLPREKSMTLRLRHRSAPCRLERAAGTNAKAQWCKDAIKPRIARIAPIQKFRQRAPCRIQQAVAVGGYNSSVQSVQSVAKTPPPLASLPPGVFALTPLLSSNHWRPPGTIKPMAQTQNRVPPQHARPGITHHRFDLFAPGALITMDRAFHADGLLHPKPAALQPDGSIIQKPLAFRAKGGLGIVMALAVTTDHRCNRLPLPGKPLAGKAGAAHRACFPRWPRASGFDAVHTIHPKRSSLTTENTKRTTRLGKRARLPGG